MINIARVKSKVRQGMVLNLTELAIASGYDRNVLSTMNLPLQANKISLQDFQRIMRKRQDAAEKNLKHQTSNLKLLPKQPASSAPEGDGQKRAAAGMFYGPSSKRAGKGASRRPRQFQLQGSA